MGKTKNNTPTKKNPYFGNYDLYSDANPKDTIRIKYDTIENTKKTIKKLERLRKSGRYTHVRIVQVTNVMTQRLRVIYNNTGKGKTRYDLSKKYFEKLKKESKKKSKSRKKSPKSKSKRKSKSRRRKSPNRKSKRKSKSRRRKSPKRKSKRKSKSRCRKSPKRKSKRKSKSIRRKKSYRKKSAAWSQKYKNSINCKSPKGFSQRAHCQSLKKKSLRRKSKKKSNVVSSIEYCTIKAKFGDKTIKDMRRLCEEPEKNGDHNEQASSMSAIKGRSSDIYTIEINHDAMIKGDEVGVDIVPGLYNFHTHPRNAYEIYDVKLGWPSGQDYIGFLLAFVEDDTIFHAVATLEGIYIISIHQDWFLNKKFTKKIGDFISKNYTFSYNKGDTIGGYLNKINGIKYNDSDRIFIVKFFPWKEAHTEFTISYAKIYDKCFTCEKEKKKFEKKLKLK